MGIYDKSRFLELQDYIQGGSKNNLSNEDESYLNVLHIINTMRRKYGRDNAVSFITRDPFNIPFRRAREMYEEAINLFFSDDSIERQSYRNMLFDELMKSAEVVRATSKNSKDMEVYGDLVTKAYKIKGLDQPDPVKVPDGLYKKPIKVYTLNTETINIPRVDRNALAARIDSIDEISEKDKKRLKRDAQIENIDFIEMYGNQEEEINVD